MCRLWSDHASETARAVGANVSLQDATLFYDLPPFLLPIPSITENVRRRAFAPGTIFPQSHLQCCEYCALCPVRCGPRHNCGAILFRCEYQFLGTGGFAITIRTAKASQPALLLHNFQGQVVQERIRNGVGKSVRAMRLDSRDSVEARSVCFPAHPLACIFTTHFATPPLMWRCAGRQVLANLARSPDCSSDDAVRFENRAYARRKR